MSDALFSRLLQTHTYLSLLVDMVVVPVLDGSLNTFMHERHYRRDFYRVHFWGAWAGGWRACMNCHHHIRGTFASLNIEED